jgi:hypothetical protein
MLVVFYAFCWLAYGLIHFYKVKGTLRRGLFELHTGFFLILLAYDNLFYMLFFLVLSAADIFATSHRRYASPALIFFYTHAGLVLAQNEKTPFFAIAPFLLVLCRLIRATADLNPSTISLNSKHISKTNVRPWV